MADASLSSLQQKRLKFQPPLPRLLTQLKSITSRIITFQNSLDLELETSFPHTCRHPLLYFDEKEGEIAPAFEKMKLGVLFSGGPAPGGHNVVTGILDAIKLMNNSSELIGFLNGPAGLIKNQWIPLTEQSVACFRNQGGFDLLGSGRTKIETAEQFEAARQTLLKNQLDGLIIIGGDDSNTNAAFLAEFCQKNQLSTRVIGVPKTIDADLRNDFIEVSFGFDTASKVYSEIIGNLLKDASSSKKNYFFVKMMGRSASHLTLECALQTHVNMALIGEEIAARGQTLSQVVEEIADLIVERAGIEKHYGVILIPEGILEFIPDVQQMIKEILSQEAEALTPQDAVKRLGIESAACFSSLPNDIQKQLLLERDAHGNVQLSKIETEKLLMVLVDKELLNRKSSNLYHGEFNPQPFFCGYEGRSALPTNFDCQYAYALGRIAALLVQFKATGYVCAIQNLTYPVNKWKILGFPIVRLLHNEIRKNKKMAVIQKALVDLHGAPFNRFQQERRKWRLADCCLVPGPIQFEEEANIADSLPLTLQYENKPLA